MSQNSQVGGKLIGTGSFGCVFKPSLTCPKEKSSDEIVSKVFFGKDSLKEAKEEILIDSMVDKIKGHEKWCHIWYKRCKPGKYDKLIKKEPELDDCLYENNILESEFDKYRQMLQGSYAGIPLNKLIIEKFTKKTFSDKELFKKEFLNLMKLMKPLFLGLKQMYHHKISHNDIKDENIMVDSEGCKYIDFGLACEFKNKAFFENRSKSEFIYDRVYPPYPYEFIYLYATPEVLKEEKYDKQHKIYRSLHDRYVLIHEQIFGRRTHDNLLQVINRFIKDGSKIKNGVEGANIVSLIDTYSLGMLVPSVLCKLAKSYGKMKQLKRYLHLDKTKSFTDLLKHMTEPDNFNRMSPDDVYHKYLELETVYLKEKKVVKRTKRRRRR